MVKRTKEEIKKFNELQKIDMQTRKEKEEKRKQEELEKVIELSHEEAKIVDPLYTKIKMLEEKISKL